MNDRPSRSSARCWKASGLIVVNLLVGMASAADFPPASIEFFEKQVRPLLVAKCVRCHGPDKAESDLRLNSRAAVLAGGSRGAAVVAGDPDGSLLIKAISYTLGDLKMPPDSQLSAADRDVLTRWVKLGLPWPNEPVTAAVATAGWDDARIAEVRERHWAFRPVHDAPPPANGVETAIDAFLKQRRDREGLSPAPLADRRVLLRRVTFDLLGLPPSPAEVAAFVADSEPDAWERVVDRLLASPQYGERWGRHWLDVARYADSSGKDENHACANAFRYRDYVVRSFNADKPYDRFVAEQIAGDLLPAASDDERFTGITATGFLQLGPKALAEQDKKKLLVDIADEQIDTVGRGLLALTLGCSRCHDHKFDPVAMQDYYALAGIFHSSKSMQDLAFVSNWLERPLANQATLDAIAAHARRVEENKKQLAALKPDDKAAREELERQRDELARTQPPPAPLAMAVGEGDIADMRINLRGNHLNLGPSVPRGFPRLIAVRELPVVPAKASGRLELAQWLTRPDQPLTPRVIVNRIWQWHFGQGLCRSPDNFGLRGQPPDHPELLDWLTARFVQSGWSIKTLHREILLSRAYRQASGESNRDPEKRLVSRFVRRRLHAEELRDALLFVSGQLALTQGGNLFNYANREPHVTYYKGPVNYEFSRRTIYLPVVRSAMLDVLELFDHGAALTSHSERDQTTVAPQALYLMNSPLVLQAAERLAARLPSDDVERIRWLYAELFQREPGDVERARAQLHWQRLADLLEAGKPGPKTAAAFCQSLLIGNEFLYVD